MHLLIEPMSWSDFFQCVSFLGQTVLIKTENDKRIDSRLDYVNLVSFNEVCDMHGYLFLEFHVVVSDPSAGVLVVCETSFTRKFIYNHVSEDMHDATQLVKQIFQVLLHSGWKH